jgi:hypothetical protein
MSDWRVTPSSMQAIIIDWARGSDKPVSRIMWACSPSSTQ